MEEEAKISFLFRLKVVQVEVGVEVAVYGWEDLWPKGIRRRFNRRPSPRATSNASGSLTVNLLQ